MKAKPRPNLTERTDAEVEHYVATKGHPGAAQK